MRTTPLTRAGSRVTVCNVIMRSDTKKALSELEHVVMDFVWSQGAANSEQVREGLAVKHPMKDATARTILRRLEQKGYVKSWFSDPTPERGGRSKRYFEITGAGEKALNRSLKVAANMLAGLREIGGTA